MNLSFFAWEQGWHTAGWTMVYFLAIGSLVALMAAPLRWHLRRASPTIRYTTSLAGFVVLALMPVGIALWLSSSLAETSPVVASQVIDVATPPLETGAPATQLQIAATTPPSRPTEHPTKWTAAQVVEYLPWVWLAGTPLTFLLLATGLIGAERLRRASRIVVDGPRA